jgi:hypothetical protein
MWNRVIASSAVVASLLCAFACGGRTDGLGSNSSSGASSSGSSSGTSGSSSGISGSSSGGTGSSSGISSSSSGGSSGSSSGELPQCVYVDPTTYDQSCNTASDCTYVTTGDVCDGFCDGCGSTLINQDGLARYEQAIAGLVPGQCACGVSLPPACVNHQCVVEGPDGGPLDGGTCVYVDPSTYDTSCKVDTDCTLIRSGEICSGECSCGGNTAINVDGEVQYKNAIAGLDLLDCPCVAQPPPFCGGGQCLEGVAAGRAHR